jgi:hypothetical protein
MRELAWAIALGFLAVGEATADVSKTLRYDGSAVTTSDAGAYQRVRVAAWPHLSTPGRPMLPAHPVFVALPQGQEAAELVVVAEESLVVATEFVPAPCPPPAILPMIGTNVPAPIAPEPDPAVYQGHAPYPRSLVTDVTTGYLRGTPVASAVVVPFRWKPARRQLVFYPRLTLRVRTKPAVAEPAVPRKVSPVEVAFRERLHAAFGIDPPPATTTVHRDAYDYLIVCARECSTVFAPLAEWKTRKGLRSLIVTRENIETGYPGADIQEQIRNCIKSYYQNYGIWCVLMGGDSEYLLTRTVWAMDCEAGMYPDENDIRSDLYLSDLDGSWDADGDGTYGEVTDQVDMFPDVLVGRAPADDVTQAQGMVDKFLVYETSAPADYQDEALFFAEILWSSPYTDAGVGKDMIEELCFPPSFDPIQKLYESLGNETPAAVIAALNDGRNVANHGGHANSTVMGAGTGYIDNSDMDGLSNTSRYTVMYSIGCWAAALDKDCIAEHYMQNTSGGGVGFIGNSRYGWGSPGNPGFGYSDLYDQEFWRHALKPGGTSGEALALMKTFFIPFSQQENVYRIHQYQVNLLGEPDLPVWTDIPSTPVVTHPTELAAGNNQCQVSVSAAGTPVTGALVCLSQDGGAYVRAYTDGSGVATLPADITTTTPVDLTVTGQNLWPYTALLSVPGSGVCLQVTSHLFEEAASPENGVPNPGEDLYLTVSIHNAGSDPSGSLTTVLRAGAGWVTVTDSTESYTSVAAGQTVVGENAYGFSISAGVQGGQGCPLELLLSAPGYSGTVSIPLVVGMPLPQATGTLVEDDGDDAHLDPGENADVTLRLRNAGNDTSYGLQATAQSLDPWLVVTSGSTAFGTVAPGAEVGGVPPLELWLGASAPVPRVAPVLLDLQDSRWSWQETVGVALGAVGFSDDMELGPGTWATPGGSNHWQRSTWRSHSGAYSWYCGQNINHQYYNGASDTLLSPIIVVEEGAMLSFWTWFDVTIYGVDGMYVQALEPGGWTTVGYIGSGGALDGMLMGHDWAMYSYDLGRLPAGSQTRVRFVFSSDGSDTEEGFYVDDVVVASCSRTPAAPAPLSADQVGSALTLTWEPVVRDRWGASLPAGASFYNVYRDTTAHFTGSPGTLLAAAVQDQAPGIAGVQWTDFSSAVGDPSVWHFYRVSAVWAGVEGPQSDAVGEVDYQLTAPSPTDTRGVR